MSSTEAIRADVRYVADTGQASRETEELRRQILSAYADIDDRSLRAAAAQDKFDKAIGRAGSSAQRQRAAVLSYRREMDALSPSVSRAQSNVSSLDRDVERMGRGALVGTGALRGLGRAAAFASTSFLGGAGIVYALRQVVAEQSTVQEETEKTNVVFGGQAHQVQAWAKTLASSFGVSESAALKAAGTFGNMLRPLGFGEQAAAKMSERLVELAADMASFNNKSPEEVLQALASGLTGQVRPLKAYGVTLSQARIQEEALADGIVKRGQKLTQAEKVQASYNIILKDTKLQQGDVARNTDSLSVAWSKLQAALQDTEGGSDTLRESVVKLVNEGAGWLGQAQNQEAIQRRLNEAVDDGTKIVHGLIDAERLIAPPIHKAVDALGGLEKAVEAALILKLATKAKGAAGSLGLIQAASAKARTQIVADAAIEERQLAAVGSQAAKTAGLVGSIGAGGAGIAGSSAGAAEKLTTGGILKKYGAKVGGPLALAAILGGTELGGSAGSNLTGAGTYAFLGSFAGPYGALAGAAGYELGQGGQALSKALGKLGVPGLGDKTPSLQQLSQAAASGQIGLDDLAKLKGFLPAPVYKALQQIVEAAQPNIFDTIAKQATSLSGLKGARGFVPQGVAGAYEQPGFLSPAQQRARDLALHPNDLGALHAQLTYDENALAFLEKERQAGKITGKKYLDQLQAITSDRDQQQSAIDQITQQAATKRAAAARAAAAKAKKEAADELKAREAQLKAFLGPLDDSGALSGSFSASPEVYRALHGTKIPQTLSGSFYSRRFDTNLDRQIADQGLQNRLSLAQLHQTQAGDNAAKVRKALLEEVAAQEAIYRQQVKDAKGLTGLALAQKRGDEIATEQAIAELKNQLKSTKSSAAADAAKNEAQFLSSAQQIIGSFAPNFTAGGAQRVHIGTSETHLVNIVQESRRTNAMLQKIAAKDSFPGSRAAQVAKEAAYG